MKLSEIVQSEWLDLAQVAHIEVTSGEGTGRIAHPPVRWRRPWRARGPGEQVIRVGFRQPTTLHRVRVVFQEAELERTQEFTLRWSSNRGETHGEIVRQQFNFSPAGATQEIEEYAVALPDVTWLELRIVPDIRGGAAHASLAELSVA